jgi:glycosyltransferase involved in cell wall biosynthesis
MRAVLTPTVDWSKLPRRDPVRLFLRRAGIGLRLVRSWARILWEARRGRYDVVVVNCDVGLTLTATGGLLLTRLPGGPPVVQVAHNARAFNRWGGDDMFVDNNLLSRVYARMVEGFSLVLMHGEATREEYARAWPSAATALIPFPADSNVFAAEPPPRSAEERILFFGDWRKVKGLHILMDAFDVLAERRASVRLTIAGRAAPADLDPDLVRRWAARYGDRVRVIDNYVPIEDVRDLFGSARVVATPYIVGFQSGVLHLAQSHARAVVTSDVGDLGTVVREGEGGIVVPAGDAAALADALEQVVADAALAERLGANGMRSARERGGFDRFAERVEAALASVNGAVAH